MREQLLKMGVYPNINGFHYLIDAVGNYRYDMPIGKLYHLVALNHNTTHQKVERAIRHARMKAEKSDHYKLIFPFGGVTNAEFIATMKLNIDLKIGREEKECH